MIWTGSYLRVYVFFKIEKIAEIAEKYLTLIFIEYRNRPITKLLLDMNGNNYEIIKIIFY